MALSYMEAEAASIMKLEGLEAARPSGLRGRHGSPRHHAEDLQAGGVVGCNQRRHPLHRRPAVRKVGDLEGWEPLPNPGRLRQNRLFQRRRASDWAQLWHGRRSNHLPSPRRQPRGELRPKASRGHGKEGTRCLRRQGGPTAVLHLLPASLPSLPFALLPPSPCSFPLSHAPTLGLLLFLPFPGQA